MAGSPPKSPPATSFTSHPSAEKLIESYMRPRVRSGENVGEFIHEADLYAKAPGDLTRQLTAATTSDGRKAWYFFTKLRFKGNYRDRWNRSVDTGEGTWYNNKSVEIVRSGDGKGPPIGQSQTFAFTRMEGHKLVRSGWIMVELRLDASDPNALCKVYRNPKAKADGGSLVAAMAGAPAREEDDEKVDAETAVADARPPGFKRKEDDKDSGAEMVAASPGRQNKAVGEGAGAATTGEICDDCRASLYAAEEANTPAEPVEVEAPAVNVHDMAGSPIKSPPVLFPSHPSAAELIDSYLHPRVFFSEKAGEFIHEADPYGKAPGDLTGRFTSAIAGDGREAWYFFTKLRVKGNYRWNRAVDTGEGAWHNNKPVEIVRSGDGKGPPIGQSQTFAFTRMEGHKQVRSGWIMVELRLDASDPNALCKVYRNPKAKVDGGSPVAAMAGAPGSKEADDESSTAAGVVVPVRGEDEEEIDAEAAATGPRLKRKAGDKDSGAETAAASPGHEKAAVGDSDGAATTGEFCVDWRASLDAAEEVEAPAEPEEPNNPSKRRFYIFL